MSTIWPTKPRIDRLIVRAIRLSVEEKTVLFLGARGHERKHEQKKRAANARKELREAVLILERRAARTP